MALLFLAALALILRARLTLSHQGMVLRGIFGTRTIPWQGIEGYRWRDGQIFIYPASDRWPMNLSHFENQGLLHAWLYCHLPDLHAAELAQEAREIGDDHELGLTGEEKAAKLAGLRRVVRAVNWIGYVAAVLGGLNALFLEHGEVQLVAASVLIGVPVALVILALRYRNQVRLDYKEGSRYPEALTGILASSLALGLISLLDPHTLIGERFYHWTLPIAAGSAALWLSLEWERILAQRRRLLIALHIASVVFLSSFWAGGSIYQVNKNSDVSAPGLGYHPGDAPPGRSS